MNYSSRDTLILAGICLLSLCCIIVFDNLVACRENTRCHGVLTSAWIDHTRTIQEPEDCHRKDVHVLSVKVAGRPRPMKSHPRSLACHCQTRRRAASTLGLLGPPSCKPHESSHCSVGSQRTGGPAFETNQRNLAWASAHCDVRSRASAVPRAFATAPDGAALTKAKGGLCNS